MSAPPGIARNDPRYRRARARFRAECEASNARCWVCHEPIDYRLKQKPGRPIDPSTFELDHARSWVGHPDLRIDPSNFRPSHMRCNRGRKTSPEAPPARVLALGSPAQTW